MTSILVAENKPTKLSRLVAEQRRRLGLTQLELARECHVERAAIANIENGKTLRPTVDLVNALARVLRLPMVEILDKIGYDIKQDARTLRRFQAIASLREQLDTLWEEPDEPTTEAPNNS